MDKLYSKFALITKASFCLLLAPLYILLSALLAVDNAFHYILVSVVPIGCLYTIPFWLTVLHLKKYRVSHVGQYAVYDILTCLFPAVIGILASDIIYTVYNEKTVASGIVTVIFGIIFLIVTLIFLLIYFILSKRK